VSDIGMAIVVLIFSAVIVVAISLAVDENREWESFKTQHKCKIVSQLHGDVFNTVGVSSKGNVVVGIGSTPDKTGWLCDDGITYFK
jgi:hypothetical protein